MSRVGKQPVVIPDQVKVSIQDNVVTVRGPLGTLTQTVPEGIVAAVENNLIVVGRQRDVKQLRALHGLTRSLLSNMVVGVASGYEKGLEIHGIGYSAQVQGRNLVMDVGFAKPVTMPMPDGIDVEVMDQTNPARFKVKGYDKQMVGEFAARVRRVRPPEPYQGKGIRYADEHIRRKAGKTFAAGA